MGKVLSFASRIRAFTAGARASVSIDFVVSIPILLAILVLTSEYGKVLRARSALDNAVADAARYLSRVPIDPDTNAFTPESVAIANALIETRAVAQFLNIGEPIVSDENGFRTVQLNAAAGVLSPALGVLALIGPNYRTPDGDELSDIEGLVITASETVRYFGR
ncbi:MAG: TadE family protein [Pseudomonadota bacterium]